MIRIFLCILTVTLLLLGYVAQKVNLVRLSYEIERKEKMFEEYLEEQKHLRFKVAYLKSPRRLEAMMEAAKISFQLPREIRIVKLRPEDLESSRNLPQSTEEDGFGSWLNWIKVAQAKTTRS